VGCRGCNHNALACAYPKVRAFLAALWVHEATAHPHCASRLKDHALDRCRRDDVPRVLQYLRYIREIGAPLVSLFASLKALPLTFATLHVAFDPMGFDPHLLRP